MKVIALLTGKGGSTLKGKNTILINKIPLLGYPCKEAKKVKSIQKFYVSSENKNILRVAHNYGFEKIIRPKKLSKKNSLHRDVLIHALNFLKKKEILPKIIVVLLANSATIKKEWIWKCIKKLKGNPSASACVPVVLNNDHHPLRAKKINHKGYLKSFAKLKKSISSNRQDLPKNFFLAHNFWVIKAKSIYNNDGESPWNFLGKNVLPFYINYSIDIHVKEDIYLTKEWLKKNKKFH